MGDSTTFDDGEDADADDTRWSQADYETALRTVESEVTPFQRRMLVAHAEAPDRMLSVRQLAAAAGYDAPQITYAQYGRLGHALARALAEPGPFKVWTRILGRDWRTQDEALIWEMHPELGDALVALGWSARPADPPTAADEELELATAGQPATIREALIAARLGQGEFRRQLVRYWDGCAVTGVSEPSVLRASHIKPWRASSNAERLDVHNGLLLAAHLDALFDAGLITFADDGTMLASDRLAPEDAGLLGIWGQLRLRTIEAAHLGYLEYHRTEVFRPR